MYKMKCPDCDRRVFDISKFNDGMDVELKCPHCHKIVTVPCIKAMCMGVTQDTNDHINEGSIKKKIS